MNWLLENKTALVCGSTAGIGKAIAETFAASGCRLILMARNEDKLKRLADSLPQKGLKHLYVVADFQIPQQPKNQLEALLSDNPGLGIDILVNNTGGPAPGPAHTSNSQAFIDAFSAHLINNHELMQICIPHMQANQWGRIINIISTSVKIPLPGLGVSNTVRGAVGNWSKTLANELGAWNITVNNVLPGATATERLEAIINKKAEKTGRSTAEISEEMRSEIPLNRFAQPQEIAAAVAFLASENANYINGINIPIDGGRTGNL
ncbi:MAG: SDR family oxidoreductase [Flavobacteriales bacterium]|nr:MAG: SDR family oxidoreductase [Flavobacteriales bacterium]